MSQRPEKTWLIAFVTRLKNFDQLNDELVIIQKVAQLNERVFDFFLSLKRAVGCFDLIKSLRVIDEITISCLEQGLKLFVA